MSVTLIQVLTLRKWLEEKSFMNKRWSHISIYVKYYGKGFFNSQSWHLLPHFAPQTVWLRFSYHLMLGLGIELTSAELHLLEGLNSRRFTD